MADFSGKTASTDHWRLRLLYFGLCKSSWSMSDWRHVPQYFTTQRPNALPDGFRVCLASIPWLVVRWLCIMGQTPVYPVFPPSCIRSKAVPACSVILLRLEKPNLRHSGTIGIQGARQSYFGRVPLTLTSSLGLKCTSFAWPLLLALAFYIVTLRSRVAL